MCVVSTLNRSFYSTASGHLVSVPNFILERKIQLSQTVRQVEKYKADVFQLFIKYMYHNTYSLYS